MCYTWLELLHIYISAHAKVIFVQCFPRESDFKCPLVNHVVKFKRRTEGYIYTHHIAKCPVQEPCQQNYCWSGSLFYSLIWYWCKDKFFFVLTHWRYSLLPCTIWILKPERLVWNGDEEWLLAAFSWLLVLNLWSKLIGQCFMACLIIKHKFAFERNDVLWNRCFVQSWIFFLS